MAISDYILLAAFVASHGPLTTPPATPASVPIRAVSACVAVTQSDVDEALGVSVGKGEEHREGGQSTCDYEGRNGEVRVTVRHLAAKLDMPVEIEALKAAIPDSKLREAPGIGTRAFFLDISGAGTQLHVLRGDFDYLMISVLGFGGPEDVSAPAGKLARKALGRL
ncbi:MAG: hypothetical protein ABSG25_02230 [Bryobacteraceae bacterium]